MLAGLRALVLALALPLLAVSGVAHATPKTITAIHIEGNDKTTDQTIREIAGISLGDPATPERLRDAEQDLISSELFQDVGFSIDDDGTVRIVVKEKLSWIAGPTFFWQADSAAFGLGYIESNFLGKNKKMLIYGQYAAIDTFFLAAYLDPSVNGSHWFLRLDSYLRHVKMTESVAAPDYGSAPIPMRVSTMNYLDAGILVGRNLTRDWSVSLRLRGAHASWVDSHLADAAETPTMAPNDDGWDFSTEGVIAFDRRHHHYGVTDGLLLQLHGETALPMSDFQYLDADLKADLFLRLFGNHNLVLKLWGMMGYHLPFEQEFLAGGGNLYQLRGWLLYQFRGDLKITATAEYSVPMFHLGPLYFRGIAFWDAGYTAFMSDDTPHRNYLPGQTGLLDSGLHNGFGLGFRIYFRNVVLPLIGIDLAYGLESNEVNFYFAVGLLEL
jgi:outer membrane protein assembly factor BamA